MAGPGSVLDFLQKHIWVPILTACVLVIGVVLLIVYCLYRRRQRGRHLQYEYAVLHEDLGHPIKEESVEPKQKREEIRDVALLNCSFYLRTNGKYELQKHLPEIGSRLNKQWFQIQDRNGQQKLLTMMKKSSSLAFDFNNARKNTLIELFKILDHPYLFPITELDFITTQEQVVVIQPFNKSGSLKDIIYGSNCLETWQTKYCFKSKGLPIPQIQLYGRQILKLLLYLEDRNLPLFTQLHSGNIMVVDNVCKMTGYETTLMGYPSKLHALLKKHLRSHPDTLEQMALGHLVFEMAAGYELDCPLPETKHIQNIPQESLKTIVLFIFTKQDGGYPTLRQIADHVFFKSVVLKEDQGKLKEAERQITGDVKSVLKQICKRNKVCKRFRKKSTSKASATSPLISVGSPIKGYGAANSTQDGSPDYLKRLPPLLSKPGKSLIQMQNPELPPKPSLANTKGDPRPKPPAPPIPDKLKKDTKIPEFATDLPPERSALLADIRKGTHLKTRNQ